VVEGSTQLEQRNNLGPGTYRVTISDGKSCQIAETFITEPLPLIKSDSFQYFRDNANTEYKLEKTSVCTVTGSNGAKTKDLVNLPPDNIQ
jgi:hypothetical protein